MDRLRPLAFGLFAAAALLGQQGARLGPVQLPAIESDWIGLAIVAAYLGFNRRRDARPGLQALATGAVVVTALLLLTTARTVMLEHPLSIGVGFDEGESGTRIGDATTLNLERRRDLNRLAGRRRNVDFRASGSVEVLSSGTHRLELDCDDACDLRIAEHRLASAGAIELPEGVHPFELRYRQLGGPAHLRIGWNTPAWIELLPMEHFIGATSELPRAGHRLALHGLFAASLTAWCALFWLALRVAPAPATLVRERRYRALPVAAAVLLVLYGSFLRLHALGVHQGRGEAPRIYQLLSPAYGTFNPESAPDDPFRADVRSYLDRAEAFSWSGFYAPSFREPFYIGLTMPFLALAGGESGILVQSLFFSCITLVLFYAMAASLHGAWWASLLLIPIALHEWLVLEAPTGYRMSAYSFFLIATVASLFVSADRRFSPYVSGLLAGLLCLIRLSALSVVAPLVLLKLWTLPTERRRRYALGFTAVAALLVGPFLLSNALAHGDPFYSISFHTEFWLRAEGLDASRGPVAWDDYLLGSGRLTEVVRGTALGLTALPLERFWTGLRHFPLIDVAILGLGILGLIVAVVAPRRRKRAFLACAYVGHLLPFAYIQNFPSGQMPRFVMPAYFFLVLAVPLATGPFLTLYGRVANVVRR